jgi:hypothetical protein
MGLDRRRLSNIVKGTQHAENTNILRTLRSTSFAKEAMWEAQVEIVALIDFCNVLRGKLQANGLDVCLKMLNLAASNNGEEIGRLERWG